jgi:hypothetical protein
MQAGGKSAPERCRIGSGIQGKNRKRDCKQFEDKAAKRYGRQGNGRKLAKAVKGIEYRVKGRKRF